MNQLEIDAAIEGRILLGSIRFLREQDGGITRDQTWNPQLLSHDERLHLSVALQEIAAMLRVDHFEVDGRYEEFCDECC